MVFQFLNQKCWVLDVYLGELNLNMELRGAFRRVPLKTFQVFNETPEERLRVLGLKGLDLLGKGAHVQKVVSIIDGFFLVLTQELRKSVYVTHFQNFINNSLFIFQNMLHAWLF